MKLSQCSNKMASQTTNSISNRRSTIGRKPRTTVTNERRKEIIETFNAFDTEGRGSILPATLLTALRIFDFSPTSAATERACKPERLSCNEFVSFLLSYSESQRQWCTEEAIEVFALYDREKRGYIADSQFKRILKRYGEILSDSEIEAEISEYFQRRNHELDTESFMALLFSTGL